MSVQILQGDAREVLATLPAESVHCAITSPPYYGLRSYSGGATEIGTEDTPERYVAALVEVFRAVHRILRDDGTCWIVIGDRYAGSWGNQGRKSERGTQRPINGPMLQRCDGRYPSRAGNTGVVPAGLKPKDLMLIPHRVALALQADGWILRQEICWSKPAPMPESVTDRCTRSHETVFMLSKKPAYYYDAIAITEPCSTASDARNRADYRPLRERDVGGRSDGFTRAHGAMTWPAAGRNKRSVWTIGPQPFCAADFGVHDDDHYAVMPEALVTPMILAGTSEAGCCPSCGAPWRRVMGRQATGERRQATGNGAKMDFHSRQTGGGQKIQDWDDAHPAQTIGWQPSCSCAAGPPIGCTVMDIFCGSGTTLLVAKKLGRSAIGVDLNPSYVALAQKRVDSVPDTLFSAASTTTDTEGAAR